jgi:hypothetical protein
MIGERGRKERRPGLGLRSGPVTSRCPLNVCGPRHVPDPRLYDREAHHGGEIIVGSDAVVPLETATQAAMHDGVLAFRARERADGRHRTATVARAVAGRLPVDVARVEA